VLIDPVGLLDGDTARHAVDSGLARWLAGGPIAFTQLCVGGSFAELTAAPATLSTPRPAWAGLPGDRPLVMGVLNVTPDSFSDGGLHFDPAAAIAAGRRMFDDGADIVDVGAESTRPGAAELPPAEEQARLLPVLRALAGAGPLSVDTRHAATMRAALDAGVRIINDVSGLSHDPAAARVVADAGCPVVLMHMRGTPATMQARTDYADVAAEVFAELAGRIRAAEAAGIARRNIVADPGIGFAKTAAQNLVLLQRLAAFHGLGVRLLVGVSRKSFIGRFGGAANPPGRLPGSLAAALFALSRGAQILRVHDVAETVQAVRIWRSCADGERAGGLDNIAGGS
jgi:dihydropteroate synthase